MIGLYSLWRRRSDGRIVEVVSIGWIGGQRGSRTEIRYGPPALLGEEHHWIRDRDVFHGTEQAFAEAHEKITDPGEQDRARIGQLSLLYDLGYYRHTWRDLRTHVRRGRRERQP